MSDLKSDKSLLEQLGQRDEQAARQLFEKYSKRLIGLAERHMSRPLVKRLDGEDVVQSVFRTFFARSLRGEFDIDATGDLWCLLVKITLAKVRGQARRHHAEKRSLDSEIPLNDDIFGSILAGQPTPDEALGLVDEVERILFGLPDTYAKILCQRLEGHTRTEIAGDLGISRQTVHRALKTIQLRMS